MEYLHEKSVVECNVPDCPGRLAFQASGAPAAQSGSGCLTEQHVRTAVVVGCTQTQAGQIPCTGVAEITAGLCERISLSGSPAVLADLQVVSNGAPPQAFEVTDPVAAKLGRGSSRSFLKLCVLGFGGAALAYEAYRLTLPNGSVREGQLDGEGRLEVDGLPPGAVATLELPNLDEPVESQGGAEPIDIPLGDPGRPFVPHRFAPFSPDACRLFEIAAEQVGVPTAWANSPGLHNVLRMESDGWVGIPNYKYGARARDQALWPSIHEELRTGLMTAESSATGLGQLLLRNVKLYYPRGVAGIGVAIDEAAGMLAYIRARYRTPERAWSLYGTLHEGY